MNKILLVAKREFLTRIQKKTFLLTTILLPLLIFAFYALIIYFQIKTGDNLKIAISDKAGIIKTSQIKSQEIKFIKESEQITTQQLEQKVKQKEYSGYIEIPKQYQLLSSDSLHIVTDKSLGIINREKVVKAIESMMESKKMELLQLSKQKIDSLHADIALKFTNLSGDEDSEAKVGISYAVGLIAGMLIYFVLFIYGTMVMRGVMEEKVNRISEVIISSLKPFQLMMGKVFGIGAVGLLQFLIWVILVFGLQMLLPLIFPELLSQTNNIPVQPMASQAATAIHQSGGIHTFLQALQQINFTLIISCFFFYFLGGYLLYASLFAAVGSAVNEDPQDAQSLTFPIIMPIIFAMVIMMQAVNDPSSGLAVFGSLFPLTSPIVMMARIAHGVPDVVPVWQLILSMLLLIAGFIGTTWLASKIYRTGILMYGKKVTLKEMIKWIYKKQ